MKVWRNLFEYVGIDALVIIAESNTQYLSGYQSSNCQIVLTKDASYFITDARYFFEAKKNLPEDFIVTISDGTGFYQLAQIVKTHNAKKIGWDGSISYKKFVELQKAFVGYDYFVDIAGQIEYCRDVKQIDEIAKIKTAQAVTDRAFDYIITELKEGVTEVEIAAKLEYFILKNNCALAFDSIVAFGANGSSPHAHRSLSTLQRGQFVTMDFGAKSQGYCSDMTRTVAIGSVDDKMADIYNTVLTAQTKAIAGIKAGMKGFECDSIARNYIESKGYGQYFTHSLGHGVGIDIHEGVSFAKWCDLEVRENAVVTVEPGIYIDGLCGVRIEDMVVVGQDGVDDLTKSNKKLIIL